MRLILACVLLSTACSSFSPDFTCTDDSQCVKNGAPGKCLSFDVNGPPGVCAFASSSCASGFAYDKSAGGDLANMCVVFPDTADQSASPFDMAHVDLTESGPPDFSGVDSKLPEYTVQSTMTTQDIAGIWGSSPTDVYAVAKGGIIIHSSGSGTWAFQSSGVTTDLFGIWGSSASDIYAVGSGATVLHSTGNGTWTKQDTSAAVPASAPLYGVWGSGAGDIYVAGSWIIHSTGNGQWANQYFDPNQSPRAIWGSGSGNVYAAGGKTGATPGALILHSTGTGTWTPAYTDTSSKSFLSISGSGPSDIYAVGYGGRIFHSTDGAVWTAQTTGQTGDLYGVWAGSATYAVATGSAVAGSASLLTSTGAGTWAGQPGAATLNAAWGSSVTNVYVGGAGGKIYQGQ